MAKSAQERKQRVRERSEQAVLDSVNRNKRSSRTVKYTIRPASKTSARGMFNEKGLPTAAVTFEMRQPKGLSLEAHWMELRPAYISPLDWIGLFTTDTDKWPDLVEEAEFEFGDKNG